MCDQLHRLVMTVRENTRPCDMGFWLMVVAGLPAALADEARYRFFARL